MRLLYIYIYLIFYYFHCYCYYYFFLKYSQPNKNWWFIKVLKYSNKITKIYLKHKIIFFFKKRKWCLFYFSNYLIGLFKQQKQFKTIFDRLIDGKTKNKNKILMFFGLVWFLPIFFKIKIYIYQHDIIVNKGKKLSKNL